MKRHRLPPHAAPKAPLPSFYSKAGLLKYDCPTPDCKAWFVTFDPVNALCKECNQTMIHSEIL